MASLGCLDKLRVLLLEETELLLAIPNEPAIGGKEKIHFFQGALIGFWVETVHHRQRDNVRDAEDVVGLLTQGRKDDRQHEGEPAITKRPANHTPSVALSPNLQGENLGRV